MKRSNFRWPAIVIFVGLALLGFARVFNGYHNQQVPDAVKIPHSNGDIHFVWRSTNELIFFREDREDSRNWLIMGQNAKTGQEKFLRRISTSITPQPYWENKHISPDGKWVLTRSSDSTSKFIWLAFSLESEQIVTCSYHEGDYYSDADWLADSQHWAEITRFQGKTEIRIRDILNPQGNGDLTVINTAFVGSLLGIDDENQGVIQLPIVRSKNQIEFIQFDLDQRLGWSKHHIIQLPKESEFLTADLSSRGQMIAFSLRFPHTMSRDDLHLRIGRLGQTTTKEVRVIPEAFGPANDAFCTPNVHWLLDAKHLSFSLKSGIWITPINK